MINYFDKATNVHHLSVLVGGLVAELNTVNTGLEKFRKISKYKYAFMLEMEIKHMAEYMGKTIDYSCRMAATALEEADHAIKPGGATDEETNKCLDDAVRDWDRILQDAQAFCHDLTGEINGFIRTIENVKAKRNKEEGNV